MGEIGCGFGLEFTKKSKSKKNHKLLNLLLPSFFYTNVAVCQKNDPNTINVGSKKIRMIIINKNKNDNNNSDDMNNDKKW